MKNWKILIGAAVVAAAAAGGIVTTYHGEGVVLAAPTTPPAMPAMPVPVTGVIKRTIPVYLEYSARTESLREVSLQAKIAGYIQAQPATDGADVKEGEL